MAKEKGNGWDDDSNAVKSNWFKANVPLEDKIFGTLIAKRQMKSMLAGKEGELTWIYDLKADEGSFHELDDSKKIIPEPVKVGGGELWSIGGKPVIDRQMQNIKLGQKIGLKFIKEKPAKTKGFNPSKVIKVYAPKNEDGSPKMDLEWIEQHKADLEFAKL